MSAEAFLDTNILLYACSSAVGDAKKRRVAERLILDQPFALSAQVLQEFVVTRHTCCAGWRCQATPARIAGCVGY